MMRDSFSGGTVNYGLTLAIVVGMVLLSLALGVIL